MLLCATAQADTLTGRVVGVTDGDTVTVLDAGNTTYKIRLAGIDAPEKQQPFGQASKQALSERVYGKEVAVEWQKRDRYGRIVGKVTVNHTDACLAQVTAGLAWHYKKYEKEQAPEDRTAYAAAEGQARAAHRGLWADTDPVPPWEWRHHKGNTTFFP